MREVKVHARVYHLDSRREHLFNGCYTRDELRGWFVLFLEHGQDLLVSHLNNEMSKNQQKSGSSKPHC